MITWLTEIYSASHVPNFIRIAPVFIKDITKNVLVSFFWTQCINEENWTRKEKKRLH